MISSLTGFQFKNFPLKYLGVPLVKGRFKIAYFNGIVDKILCRINGWKSNHLSAGGRIVLIKHVLSSIPLYTIACTAIPKGVHSLIEKHLAIFLWGSKEGGFKRHWRAWRHVCKPIDQGGLGIIFFRDMQLSMRVKMLWNAMTSYSLWSKYFRAKYFRSNHIYFANLHLVHTASKFDWQRAKELIQDPICCK